jgi:hypothetical protein
LMKKPHQHKVLPVVVFSSLAPLAEVARRSSVPFCFG